MCLIAIVALGAGAEFATFARSDTAFLLYAAERVLDGARLYLDVVEINPPLIVALNLPAVLLARPFGVSDIAIYRALVTLALLGALAFADWSLRRALEPGSDRLRRRLVLVLAFALFLAPGNDFGQREHLLVGLALPWVLLAVGRVSGRPAPAGPALAAGVLAGLGLALKPHFLLVWAAVEGYAAWRLRARRPSYEALGAHRLSCPVRRRRRHPHAAVFRSRPAARPGVRRLRARPVPARAGHGARHHGVLSGGARRRRAAARVEAPGAVGRPPGGAGGELRRGRGAAEGLGLPLLPGEGVCPRRSWRWRCWTSVGRWCGRCSRCTPRRPSPRWRPACSRRWRMGIVRVRHRDPARQAEQAQLDELVAAVRRHTPPGGSLYVFSYTIGSSFPLVNYSGVRWASRFPHLWIIEAVVPGPAPRARVRFGSTPRRKWIGPSAT